MAERDIDVLELRVHGVNNTTPAALADLPPFDLRQVRGDKRASFWLAQPDIAPRPGERGHIPPGIRRESYSWGGLVRDDPGSQRWLATITLAFQVFALPFSLGNAAMWAGPVDDDGRGRRRTATVAGAARLFGLVLTLLFTSTAITIAVDLAALQCAQTTACDGPWQGAWAWITGIVPAAYTTPDRVLAVFALVPVAAVGFLVWIAGTARRRYDTLHRKAGTIGTAARRAMNAPETAERERAVLSNPAFWSNRVTGRLGLLHFAAAITLTTSQVAWHVGASTWLFGAAVATGAVTVVAVVMLPTQAVVQRGRLTAVVAWSLLGLSVAELAALVLPLWFGANDVLPQTEGLSGAGLPPLILVTVGILLALSGAAWRQSGTRAGTAWSGNGPAVFMAVSLALAILTSAAVIALASMLATGWDGPAMLGDGVDRRGGLGVPSVFLAVGSMLSWAIGAILLVLATFLIPRRVFADRLLLWVDADGEADPTTEAALATRVARRRRRSALVHLVEPAAAVVALCTSLAIVVGLVWAWTAQLSGGSLAAVAITESAGVAGFLSRSIVVLTGVGAVLAVVVAVFGVFIPRPGLVAIVWDITCFLPRTAQPFGPACYAERAVPDVAQRLQDWLDDSPDHRAVLAAHSMGAMVAVSALALLGAVTPDHLSRVSLLTFGVQLRVFFGRFFPDLVGPAVLGTFPARAPRPWRPDPWSADASGDELRAPRAWTPPAGVTSISTLSGGLLPAPGVRWISLWRLTDYLGFPAAAGTRTFVRGDATWRNEIDVYAGEIDRTVEPPIVVAHNDYFRVSTYEAALVALAAPPPEAGTRRRWRMPRLTVPRSPS